MAEGIDSPYAARCTPRSEFATPHPHTRRTPLVAHAAPPTRHRGGDHGYLPDDSTGIRSA